ncbi:hypothetical protein BKA63DRAFT_501586 [Paraphoma chrysanthemicola]|nr:hypothetical protein BKA63DRAFT_501586 [Paraphoma chrysanthemicola]
MPWSMAPPYSFQVMASMVGTLPSASSKTIASVFLFVLWCCTRRLDALLHHCSAPSILSLRYGHLLRSIIRSLLIPSRLSPW